ncbi:MAG: hypothetical protein FJ194_16325 [Gammaproteobacteria bacterium]|nr:hypothetical protein [Gammaproteobacteria bacterium]
MRWHSCAFSRVRARYRVIRNGTALGRFQPGDGQEVRAALGIARDDFVIGMFASFKPVKNHALLLQAVAKLIESGHRL